MSYNRPRSRSESPSRDQPASSPSFVPPSSFSVTHRPRSSHGSNGELQRELQPKRLRLSPPAQEQEAELPSSAMRDELETALGEMKLLAPWEELPSGSQQEVDEPELAEQFELSEQAAPPQLSLPAPPPQTARQLARQRYRQSDKGKEMRQLPRQRYRQSDKGKAVQQQPEGSQYILSEAARANIRQLGVRERADCT